MNKNWQDQKERAGIFWISILVWIALNLGRTIVLLALQPVCLFYLFVAGDATAASKNYLQRVYKRPPSWREVWQHFFCFATVAIDRLYFLAGKTEGLSVSFEGGDLLQRYVEKKQGCIILVSHLGSFDALRVSALAMKELPLKILMDHQHNASMMKLFDALNPEFADCIIDSNQSAPALALTLAENLQQGNMIGIMADRYSKHEQQIPCKLLDSPANLPTGPWLLANALKVPVLLCFGLYRGKNQYSVHVEVFSEKLDIKRRERQSKLAAYMQQYADKIEYYLKQEPYNWFNFYDFWQYEAETKTDKKPENATTKN